MFMALCTSALGVLDPSLLFTQNSGCCPPQKICASSPVVSSPEAVVAVVEGTTDALARLGRAKKVSARWHLQLQVLGHCGRDLLRTI